MSDPLFSEIEKKVQKSYPDSCICWIEKVVNENLEKEYEKYKSSIKTVFEEKTLFHGTKPHSIDSIVKEGFDPSKNKRSAHGKGTYFARDALFSCDYSESSNDGLCYMIVASVVVDQQTKTDKSKQIFVIPQKYACIPRFVFAFSKNT